MMNNSIILLISNKHLINIISSYILYPVKYQSELLIKTKDIFNNLDFWTYYVNYMYSEIGIITTHNKITKKIEDEWWIDMC